MILTEHCKHQWQYILAIILIGRSLILSSDAFSFTDPQPQIAQHYCNSCLVEGIISDLVIKALNFGCLHDDTLQCVVRYYS